MKTHEGGTKKSAQAPRIRTDELRKAFNTPFWPYVLATTAVGQEGLDFHTWCDTIIHWDLCRNPVDLEQREGRIQRYGGLSIRRAIVREVAENIQSERKAGESPWVAIQRWLKNVWPTSLALPPGGCIRVEVFDVMCLMYPRASSGIGNRQSGSNDSFTDWRSANPTKKT